MMYTYGICCLLPDTATSYHDQLWQKIEARFHLTGRTEPGVPAHITLKYPFQAEAIAEVEEVVQAFSAKQTPTQWAVKGFNFFQTANDFVIFMDVFPTPEAQKAHTRLVAALQQIDWMQWIEFDTDNIHYHVTLAHQGLTKDNFEAVWAFVNQQIAPNCDLLFDNLALIQTDGETGTTYRQYWFPKKVAA